MLVSGAGHIYQRFPVNSPMALGKVGRLHGGYGRPYSVIRGDIKRFSGPGDKRVSLIVM